MRPRSTSLILEHPGAALACVLAWSICATAAAQGTAESKAAGPPIDARGIDGDGALVIVGGGRMGDDVLAKFRSLAPGDRPKLVVIPTASDDAESDVADPSEAVARWKGRGFEDVAILHTRDRRVADDPAFVAPLKAADAVWFDGGDQSRIADAYLDTAVESEVYEVLRRGGVVGGTSAGAAIQSRVMITGGNPVATLSRGFDLLPGTILDQHFLKRSRQPRLRGVLEHYPNLVGIGIDESTALVARGRSLEVVGASVATVMLGASEGHGAEEIVIKPGGQADLVALRRAARDRLRPAFPPSAFADPKVEAGSLVIVGGGGVPKGVVERFVELAGGPDAMIVVVPTADERPIDADDEQVGGVGMLKAAGARRVGVLRGRTREEIETPKQVAMLKEAKGVWFGGGRQWRFVDAYEGTPVVGLFRDVLRRGGVIGGSSAGATIQGDYLVRGNPLGNTDMMARGYERGFAFLPGTAIDQHFAQRDRFADLAAVVDRFPQVLGIGIDESTALIVRGAVAEVVGDGATHFYDRRTPGAPDHETVGAGGRYDLAARRVVDADRAASTAADKLSVVLISGSEEYKSDESLAAFETYLESNGLADCTLLKAAGVDALPGVDALDDCDAAVFFTRRLKIDGEELERIKNYAIKSGKPIVGVRTASHGFQNWLEMDAEVFGGSYRGHYKNELTTEVAVSAAAKDHPIVTGFEPYTSIGSLYQVSPLAEDATALLTGTSPEAAEPVAWVREANGRRVFYTSLGHPDDFQRETFRRFLARGILWAAAREAPAHLP